MTETYGILTYWKQNKNFAASSARSTNVRFMMKQLSEKYLQKNTPHLSGLRGRGIHVLGTFFYDPEEGSGENNSFYNSSGRKCPPDTVQTKRGAAKKHGKRDAGTGEHDADDTA